MCTYIFSCNISYLVQQFGNHFNLEFVILGYESVMIEKYCLLTPLGTGIKSVNIKQEYIHIYILLYLEKDTYSLLSENHVKNIPVNICHKFMHL